MSGGQVAALIFAILLLLPGGCFLIAGVAAAIDSRLGDAAIVALLIAAALLGFSVFLFRFALRRRPTGQANPHSNIPGAPLN